MTESKVVNRLIEKAMAQTELETRRTSLIIVLEARFPGVIAPEFLDLIRQQESLEMLQTWLLAAVRENSPEKFLAVLRQQGLSYT